MQHSTLTSYGCLAAPRLNLVKIPAPIEFFSSTLVTNNIRIRLSCDLHRIATT